MNTITNEFLEQLSAEFPICEYAFGTTDQIPFSDKVLFICQTDCKRYGHSWACPPHAGEISENIARCRSYSRFFLFSTVWEVSDAWNTEVCLEAKKAHEALTREFREQLSAQAFSFYTLSSGCSICDVCACPDEPCRHPEDRLPSMESHGIVIMQLVEEMGLTFSYDGTTAVYFSMILY